MAAPRCASPVPFPLCPAPPLRMCRHHRRPGPLLQDFLHNHQCECGVPQTVESQLLLSSLAYQHPSPAYHQPITGLACSVLMWCCPVLRMWCGKQKGETCAEVANIFSITVATLKSLNPELNCAQGRLPPGLSVSAPPLSSPLPSSPRLCAPMRAACLRPACSRTRGCRTHTGSQTGGHSSHAHTDPLADWKMALRRWHSKALR